MSALSGAGRYGAPAVSAELISRCNFRVPYGRLPWVSLNNFNQETVIDYYEIEVQAHRGLRIHLGLGAVVRPESLC